MPETRHLYEVNVARRKKADEVVDGYTTLQAAQRAAAKRVRAQQTSRAEAVATFPDPKPDKGTDSDHGAGKVRVGHTAQPTRHDIVCYECGFSFFLTGQLKSTYCPKCRSILEATEQTIEGDWNASLKTIGLIRIAPNGVVKEGGRISANCVVLEGRIEGGKVEVFGKLFVSPGGRFVPEVVRLTDLVVSSGARLNLDGDLSLRSIEIAGEVVGKLRTTGLAVVRAGGRLSGDLVGHHLVVEDGAVLNATIAVTPRDAGAGQQGSHSRNSWATVEGHRRSAA